jgi:hypothetical protein
MLSKKLFKILQQKLKNPLYSSFKLIVAKDIGDDGEG